MVNIDASKRNRDERLNRVFDQFDEKPSPKGSQRATNSRKVVQQNDSEDDDDDIVAMMDKMNR